MPNPVNIGLIGLDTSHVIAFARLLHQGDDPHHVPGGRIGLAYPGGTADWPLSADRVEGFTRQLRDEFGVVIADSPEAVAREADLVFITAADGRQHRALLQRVLGAGKPVFVDKPFATSTADAEAMAEAAAAAGVPLMSCSSLRYAEPFAAALADEAHGPIAGIDVYGPMAIEAALPGYFWYGCHGIEMVVAAMGPGCVEVHAVATDAADVLTMRWADGRVATYRGQRDTHHRFGATLHRARGSTHVDATGSAKPHYAGMLQAILASLPRGRSAVPTDEMIEIVQIMETGNRARHSGDTCGIPQKASGRSEPQRSEVSQTHGSAPKWRSC